MTNKYYKKKKKKKKLILVRNTDIRDIGVIDFIWLLFL